MFSQKPLKKVSIQRKRIIPDVGAELQRKQAIKNIAAFGMGLNHEREMKHMLVNMSTTATYDTSKAYQQSVMPRIPTKVKMNKIRHVKTASQEELFIHDPDIESPNKPGKKKANLS